MKTKKLLLAVGRHEKGDFGVWVEDPETAGGLPVVCIFRGSKESCEKYINSFPIIKAAPALLKVCKRVKAYLASLPGKYAIESRHLQAEVKAAIFLAEKVG